MVKRTISALLILLLPILISSSAFSQGKQMNLDDAIRFSLENNHEMKSAVLEIQKAQHAVKEAFGYALPNVGISANFSHFLEKPQMLFPDFESLLTNATFSILEIDS